MRSQHLPTRVARVGGESKKCAALHSAAAAQERVAQQAFALPRLEEAMDAEAAHDITRLARLVNCPTNWVA